MPPPPPPPLKRFPAATTPIEEIVAAMHSDGGCIVERMYDAATITEMREAVLAKAARDADADAAPGSATFGYSTSAETRTEAAQEAGTSYVGSNTIRFSSLGKIAPAAFFRMLDNSVYKAVCDRMLLPYCGTYWVNTARKQPAPSPCSRLQSPCSTSRLQTRRLLFPGRALCGHRRPNCCLCVRVSAEQRRCSSVPTRQPSTCITMTAPGRR
jgi:hypothetical protein